MQHEWSGNWSQTYKIVQMDGILYVLNECNTTNEHLDLAKENIQLLLIVYYITFF